MCYTATERCKVVHNEHPLPDTSMGASNTDFPEVGSPGFLYTQKWQQNPGQIKSDFYRENHPFKTQ